MTTPDNLVQYIIMYKIKHFNNFNYDENGVLVNNNGIRFNFDFVEFCVDNKYLPDFKKNKILFNEKLKKLSLLVEVEKKYLLDYILRYLKLIVGNKTTLQ